MRLKQKTLLCAALLLAAVLLGMQMAHLHFTPRAAFEDACLGMKGTVIPSAEAYDAGSRQYYLFHTGGTFGVCTIKRSLGFLWTPGRHFIDRPSSAWSPFFAPVAGIIDKVPIAYAVPLDPAVDHISLRLDREGAAPEILDTVHPCGGVYFWYLPNYFPEVDVKEALEGCTLVFLAYGVDGTQLDELSYWTL